MKEYTFFEQSLAFTTNMPENFLVRLGDSLAEIEFLNHIVTNKYIGEFTYWVDAGANIGNHTVALSKVNPLSECFSVEANADIFNYLEQNVKLNRLSNVNLLCGGLSDVGGSPFISNFNSKQIGASTVSVGVPNSDRLTLTIDDIIPKDKPTSFIKIDCEGHDLEVLKGAYNTIKRDLPVVAIEIWKPYVWERLNLPSPKNLIIELLEPLGYSLVYNDVLDNHIFECR